MTLSVPLDALPDAAWITDAHGIVVHANARSVALVGRPLAQIVGQPWWVTSPAEDALDLRAQAAARPAGIVRRLGGRMVETTLVPLPSGWLGHDRPLPVARDAALIAVSTMALDGALHDIDNAVNAIGLHLPLLQEVWQDALPVLAERAAADPRWRPARLPWERLREALPRATAAIADRGERILALSRALAALRGRPAASGTTAAAQLLLAHHARRAGATVTFPDDPDALPVGALPVLLALVPLAIDAAGPAPRRVQVSIAEGRITVAAEGDGPPSPPDAQRLHLIGALVPGVSWSIQAHGLHLLAAVPPDPAVG